MCSILSSSPPLQRSHPQLFFKTPPQTALFPPLTTMSTTTTTLLLSLSLFTLLFLTPSAAAAAAPSQKLWCVAKNNADDASLREPSTGRAAPAVPIAPPFNRAAPATTPITSRPPPPTLSTITSQNTAMMLAVILATLLLSPLWIRAMATANCLTGELIFFTVSDLVAVGHGCHFRVLSGLFGNVLIVLFSLI
ncbi:hypothetical protein Syun_008657 [Stephania yunnanensis]|uniref:Uncharacterized protein n=1 Tax=Stephania yunnanensis TaxID=152371 RepID=A0AAP0KER3_9MAGN